MDFRFISGLRQWMEERKILGDCDIIAAPGAAKIFVDPQMPEDTDFLLRSVGVGVNLHRVQKVILMNHMDCGAYGGAKAFSDAQAERTRYERDLRAAAAALRERYPHVTVVLMLAMLQDDGMIRVEELPETPTP